MSDFLDEIKEDLQYEKTLRLWKQYQNYIINGVAGILIVIAAYVAWNQYQASKNIERSKNYCTTLWVSKPTEALHLLEEISQSGNSIYNDFARLKAAGILSDQKNWQGASDIYTSIRKSNTGGPIYENLATIAQGYVTLGKVKDPSFLKPLEPLLKEGNPWRGSALELKGLYHIDKKEWAAAIEAFDTLIKDKEVLQTIKTRAIKLRVFALEQQAS